jgi:CRP/FNR family transcriptional regulator
MNELQRDTVVSLLSDHEWFSPLLPDELDELAASAETLYWSRGQIVFEEGDQGNECYLLHTGVVKVVRRFPDGRRVTLARMGPGSVVGELALFNGERRSATVEAVEPTVAVALAGDRVMSLLRGDAEAALRVAVGLAERLRASNERLFEHALATVAGRVAATLLGQVEARQAQIDGDGGGDIELVGSSVDVARLAGVPRESASRVLHWLENEGIVTLKRGKTVVHDPDALSRYLS